MKKGWCQNCGGFGFLGRRDDPSPRGVGLSAGWYWEVEECPDCLGAGLCPGCGEELSGESCPCGWDPEEYDPEEQEREMSRSYYYEEV